MTGAAARCVLNTLPCSQPYSRHDELTFVTMDGSPLCLIALRNVLRFVPAAVGDNMPGEVTLHSLRRGGTQVCVGFGTSIQNIKDLGIWSSNDAYSYVVKAQVIMVTQKLSSLFGCSSGLI